MLAGKSAMLWILWNLVLPLEATIAGYEIGLFSSFFSLSGSTQSCLAILGFSSGNLVC